MLKILKISSTLMICLGLLMAFQRTAYAYVDPGTGLLALQAVGASLAAVGFAIRRKIYALFRRKQDTPPADLAATPSTAAKTTTK
jgi:hypothetical protein